MKFSIIIVSLNPGQRLRDTLDSIKKQKYKDYEVILKDGGSIDGSLDNLEDYQDINLKIYIEPDKGIYDAMNQALAKASGEFVYFLNCGDYFVSEYVLEKVGQVISDSNYDRNVIFYGNIYERRTKEEISSNPSLNGFGLYRNVPCHQACFYDRELISEHPFETEYKVRADYEQFLWCYYKKGASLKCMDIVICDYEGDGFSETKEHLKLSKKEHKKITDIYMDRTDVIKYKCILLITLAPLRTKIARNPKTAAIYNKLKKRLYENSVDN